MSCIYHERVTDGILAITLAAAHAEIILKEDEGNVQGDVHLHETSLSMFLCRGLDLEDIQYMFLSTVVSVQY